jgi:hypothetical protein
MKSTVETAVYNGLGRESVEVSVGSLFREESPGRSRVRIGLFDPGKSVDVWLARAGGPWFG